MQCQLVNGEDARLAALNAYNILDTSPEHTFDRLTRLARMALQMPTVLISLVDQDRQWFKSRQGFDISQTPRSVSFCAHAIQQSEPFIVTDAAQHPLFRDNPFVTGEPFIRFYIGIPLQMSDGFVIGTLCAMDTRPRSLSIDEIDVLQDLAQMVVDAIELRRMATTDSLTGALTRRGFDTEIGREFSRAKRSRHNLSLIGVDIDHFKSVNDRYGHAVGDLILKSLVSAIKDEVRSCDIVARLGGEEFAIALPETDLRGAHILAERIRERIARTEVVVRADAIRITASFGIAACDPADTTWAAALENADAALYRAKRSGRNKCLCHDDMSVTDAA